MTENPIKWEDMSNYIVHFTKTEDGSDDYKSIMSIYFSRHLEPKRPFGIGKSKAPEDSEQRAVCFSEIPPGQWQRLIERRGTKYGLAFTKDFIISRKRGRRFQNDLITAKHPKGSELRLTL